ncbi:unnamed protein product [Arabis nemorensis]|uniref:Uncharacterized protein n=1 Tax=Arabis nemorensis TaxID=586526 RepID=A0A565B3S5_9BRAS|nr:unnamed protein product [Arabis nemorensis]
MGKAVFKKVNYAAEKKKKETAVTDPSVRTEGSARTRPAPSTEKTKKLSTVEKASGKCPAGSATLVEVAKKQDLAALVSQAAYASRKRDRSSEGRTEKTQMKSHGEDLQLIAVEGSGVAAGGAEQQSEEPVPGAYDYAYSFKGAGKQIMDEPRACADFLSLI